jgi:hypothetical protein
VYLIKFMGDSAERGSDALGEIEYQGKEILTLTGPGADQENNQGRTCCRKSQLSKSEGIRGTFGYKKQD